MLGLAVIIAVPALVTVVAPAGLAGGATVLAGLAALGPGGLMRGLMLVGALGAGGGGLAAVSARSLTTGSRTTVQQNLVLLEALARARHALAPYEVVVLEAAALANMDQSLRDELDYHQGRSDKRSRIIGELKGKLKDVVSTRKRLAKDGIIAELDDVDRDGNG